MKCNRLNEYSKIGMFIVEADFLDAKYFCGKLYSSAINDEELIKFCSIFEEVSKKDLPTEIAIRALEKGEELEKWFRQLFGYWPYMANMYQYQILRVYEDGIWYVDVDVE